MDNSRPVSTSASSPRPTALEQSSVDRFCFQYMQLEPRLDYPDGHLLKLPDVQDEIFRCICRDHEQADPDSPPRNARFELRTLKELARRIQASIGDDEADEYVRPFQASIWLGALWS